MLRAEEVGDLEGVFAPKPPEICAASLVACAAKPRCSKKVTIYAPSKSSSNSSACTRCQGKRISHVCTHSPGFCAAPPFRSAADPRKLLFDLSKSASVLVRQHAGSR